MWHTVTISFSTKNKNWIILKLTFSRSNMNQSSLTVCCTVRAFDILRLDSGLSLCLLFKHKKVCSDQRDWKLQGAVDC